MHQRSHTHTGADNSSTSTHPAKEASERARRHTHDPSMKASEHGRKSNSVPPSLPPFSSSFIAFTASLPGQGKHPASPKPFTSNYARGATGLRLHYPYGPHLHPSNAIAEIYGKIHLDRLEAIRALRAGAIESSGERQKCYEKSMGPLSILGKAFANAPHKEEQNPLPEIPLGAKQQQSDAKNLEQRVHAIIESKKLILLFVPPGCNGRVVAQRLAAEFPLLVASVEDQPSKPAVATSEVSNEEKPNQHTQNVQSKALEIWASQILTAAPESKGVITVDFPSTTELAEEIQKRYLGTKAIELIICMDGSLDVLTRCAGIPPSTEFTNKLGVYKLHITSMVAMFSRSPATKVTKIEIQAPMNAATIHAVARNALLHQITEWRPSLSLNLKERPLFFVLGGPGSGKGTQCAYLREIYNFKHLSVGDLLRAEIESQSDLGKYINGFVTEGKIVPIDVTLKLLGAAVTLELSASGPQCSGFLIDGFPREIDQCIKWEQTMCIPAVVLFFDCAMETLEKRLLKRGETSGRSDDNIESIKKRFVTFRQASMPVVEYYRAIEKIAWVNSEASVDSVFASTCEKIDRMLKIPKLSFPNVVYVLGGPGSGKGTQCAQLVTTLHYTHLSTGDLLRAEVSAGSEIGKKADAIMKEGGMVPLEIIRSLLLSTMKKSVRDGASGFLIDGYPRTIQQAQDILIIAPARCALYYECPENELVQRLLKRGETSGRSDDNAESIKARIQTFLAKSMPVIEYFESKNILKKVDATKGIEDITKATLEALGSQ